MAILLVILTHCGGGWHAALSIVQDTSNIPDLALPKLISKLTIEAGHGVQLFFVVSAFTLTLRSVERDDSILAYACRRIARIGPAYWIAGAYYLLIGGLSPRLLAPDGVSYIDMIMAGGFLSAWQGGPSLAIVPGGWSVSCEASFYVLLPFIIFLVSRRVYVSICLYILSLIPAITDIYYAGGTAEGIFSVYVKPIQQMPVFIIGIMAAMIVINKNIPKIPLLPMVALIASLILPPMFFYAAHVIPTYIVFSFFAAIAVIYAAVYPPAFLTNRLMVRIGTVSYSMYLVHFVVLPIGMKVATFLTSSSVAQLAIHFGTTTAIAFAVSNMTYVFIEKPPMRWMAKMLSNLGFGPPKQISVHSK